MNKPISTTIKELYLLQDMSIKEISEQTGVPEENVKKILVNLLKRHESAPEKKIGQILSELFPKQKIAKQARIGNLFIDYYLPDLRLAIEVDGIQHSQAVGFFHGKTPASKHFNFDKQVDNDRKKDTLAKQDHIYMIRIPHTEKLTTDNINRIINEHFPKILDNLSDYTAATRIYE